MSSLDLRDSPQLPLRSKGGAKKYNLSITISKISENYLEWAWDNESEGHYKPIISRCYETTKYGISLEEINVLFREMSEYPLIITELRITELRISEVNNKND